MFGLLWKNKISWTSSKFLMKICDKKNYTRCISSQNPPPFNKKKQWSAKVGLCLLTLSIVYFTCKHQTSAVPGNKGFYSQGKKKEKDLTFFWFDFFKHCTP